MATATRAYMDRNDPRSIPSEPPPGTSSALSVLSIIASDAATLVTVFCGTAIIRQLLNGHYEIYTYFRLWPVLLITIATYASVGLYPGIAVDPVLEIKRITKATTLVFLFLGCMTFIMRNAVVYSRSVFVISWIAAVIAIPLSRTALRHFLGRKRWWGSSVVVFGHDPAVQRVASELQDHPERGLKVFSVLDQDLTSHKPSDVDRARELVRIGIKHAVVVTNGLPTEEFVRTLQTAARRFPHVLIVPNLPGLASLAVETHDLGKMVTLRLRNSLLLRGPQTAKRILDMIASVVGGVLISPLVALIAIAIKLDSKGPVVYSQIRIGRTGRPFAVWKFRTMVSNAEDILFAFLRSNPAAKDEWKHNHKLRNDPRITNVGRFLRKTSLDELPQLWNVLRGEMSLVGPRPIVDAEISKYGDAILFYTQVAPGLTGLWQVCRGHSTTYEERVNFDSYYVRNWSTWLDIYLLGKTLFAVLKGEGAY